MLILRLRLRVVDKGGVVGTRSSRLGSSPCSVSEQREGVVKSVPDLDMPEVHLDCVESAEEVIELLLRIACIGMLAGLELSVRADESLGLVNEGSSTRRLFAGKRI